MKTAKIVQISERQTVDRETGEIILSEQERVIQIPKEPPYVKMYLEDLGDLLGVPQGPRGVLVNLVRRVDYDGCIQLTIRARQKICEALGIQQQTLRNYLHILCKSTILRSNGGGEYEMNPDYFGRGEWKDIYKRRQAWELNVRYSPDGNKTITGRAVAQMDLEDYLGEVSEEEAHHGSEQEQDA